MIVAAAFCPHPPVLVPEVAQSAAPELDDLRAACRTAIQRIDDHDRRLVLLGAGPASRAFGTGATGTFAGFGVALRVSLGAHGTGTPELPLSLAVGAWLLRDALGLDAEAEGWSIGPDWGTSAARAELHARSRDNRTALIVMGDGSARRSTAAPGYLDERAEPYDAAVAAALASGDGAQLHARALPDAGELLVAGAPVWDEAAVLLEGSRFEADLLYDAAPYGVGYLAAAWT